MRMKALRILLLLGLAGTFAVRAATRVDWLLDPSTFKAQVARSADGKDVVLDNGLVRRVIRLAPNATTVSFENLMTGESIIRAVRPEARVVLDGVRYDIGGLAGQPEQAFLKPTWIETLKANPDALQFTGLKAGQTEARFAWKKRREWMPKDMPWPPPGVSLTLEFRPPAGRGGHHKPGEGLSVEVHYELFDGLPLVSKWMVVRNGTAQAVRLNSFVCEILAAVESESYVDDNPRWDLPNLYVETDDAFGGMGSKGGNHGVHWEADPEYLSQVNYNRRTPCLLECRPPLGPDQEIAPGGSFESFRAFELAQDNTERERKGLAQRRMYRTIAPWVTENPGLMHVRSARPDAVRLAIDQCAE